MGYTVTKGKWIYKITGAVPIIYIVNTTKAKALVRAGKIKGVPKSRLTAKRMPKAYNTNTVWLNTMIRKYKLLQ